MSRNQFLLTFVCICFLFTQPGIVYSDVSPDINTILMRSTFKIKGSNGSVGTVFILGQEISKNQTKARYVLITAAHVLEGIVGDNALLVLREKVGDKYNKLNKTIKIRDKGKILWTKHPKADVAAMYIALPSNVDILLASLELLATDETIKDYEIYPGRELTAIGFPFGFESNESGFPILRSGKIANFPLTPTKETRTFLVDFEIFGGNSGGPVYLHDPDWHKRGSGIISAPVELQVIMGLVSKQKIVTEEVDSYMKKTIQKHQLGIAEIVHASLIKETILLLKP